MGSSPISATMKPGVGTFNMALECQQNEVAACDSKLCKKNAARPSRLQIGQEFKDFCLFQQITAMSASAIIAIDLVGIVMMIVILEIISRFSK